MILMNGFDESPIDVWMVIEMSDGWIKDKMDE